MRYIRKRFPSMSFLLLYTLAAVLSCSSDLSQAVDTGPPAAAISIGVDRTMLVGHVAHATATVNDSAGNLIINPPIKWTSLNPAIATVSASGNVIAVDSGSAVIEGQVSGISSESQIIVVLPPNLASQDFNNGAAGFYTQTADVDFPEDPTGSGHGKVARMLFNPVYDSTHQTSNDEHVRYTSATHYRYGATIWFRGEVYIPSSGSAHKAGDTRKLVDFWGSGPNSSRMILDRQDAAGQPMLYLASFDPMGDGIDTERFSVSTGIVLRDNTWYTLEVKMVTNSADNVRDGELHIYINGSPTASYSRTTGIGWITEQLGGTYFNTFNVGSQLTIQTPTDPVYSEYRYWDNVAFSTTRIGQ